ncbi:hypothetical protein Moror_16576 [Moniliophthora roreri MCA 2997]|uniref:Reverse transcriptase domain-containing protein n=1 Tax=Moniliophthora roreri (strain MCA 2997) TaxID=1381753 RepID=V2WJY3_MONRO|nr:hypothetical protein Moror_16576 [Moniliophthora roreri MCA 2997]
MPLDQTGLPPLQAINHEILLIDENKTYPWQAVHVPKKFRDQWIEKRDAYLKTSRWKHTTSTNAVPIMFIPKPKNPTKLQIVVDLRARNDNTKKMASPLLDIQAILNKVAAHKYRTMMDLDGAYEQLRVHSNHVDQTTVTTPDRNLVSLVVQQGDCHTPAFFQALMNHIFSSYIGHFMYVYLDDIVMFSNSLAEHMRHVKLIIDILKQEKLYLSKPKLQILAPEIDILGHIVDENGIKMDPNKVDSIANWKPPMSRELLHRFLGAYGYLADNVD